MALGNFLHGDYFIDCNISQSLAQTIFGVWINVCVIVVGVCARSIHQSRLRSRLLLTGHNNKQGVSLLVASPATTVAEFVELRSIILRGIFKKEHLFVITSLACIFLAIVSAASTAIANRTIVRNVVTRKFNISGFVVVSDWADGIVPVSILNSRVEALNNAGAPLEELFDFVPDDTSNWLYAKDEWDNSWRGKCSYDLHPSVDLVVFPTDEPDGPQFQVPALATVLPPWVTTNSSTGQYMYSSCYSLQAAGNGSDSFRDCLLTYAFNNPPDTPLVTNNYNNITLVNILLHEIGMNISGYVVQTAFKSDVHVADCTFHNAYPEKERRARGGGRLRDAVISIDQFYHREVIKASIAQKPVIQPTARHMLRIWQAYQSAKDAGDKDPGQRTISASQAVVQMRLSVLATTLGVFAIALSVAAVFRLMEPRDSKGRRVPSPSSQLDWVVQAVRECKEGEYFSTDSQAVFATHRNDLAYVVSATPEGQMTAKIVFVDDVKSNDVQP